MSTLFLGEALVDLVCERPVSSLEEADSFVPHAGGAIANAAVAAARCGGDVQLVGGVGEDHWGNWLRSRLSSEGVGLDWFATVAEIRTPLAFVTLDDERRPDFLVYDETIPDTMQAIAPLLEEATGRCDALLFGSNTLVGERERHITAAARDFALAEDKPIIFDPNLRLHRWRDRRSAIECVRSFCSDTLLLKVNAEEAEALTGESEPAVAAEALAQLGARVVIVTLGTDGALARGTIAAATGGMPADAVDTTGAGDIVTGVLIAALSQAGFDPHALHDALPHAVEAASRSTEGWGAIDSLPDPMPRFT